jgi:hypothetical protein
MPDVTQMLSAIDASDQHAAEQLLPLVYDELRKLRPSHAPNRKSLALNLPYRAPILGQSYQTKSPRSSTEGFLEITAA